MKRFGALSRWPLIVAIALVFTFSPAPVRAASLFRTYAGAQTCTLVGSQMVCDNFYGIDGFVWLSAINPYPQFFPWEAEFAYLNLCSDVYCTDYVQIGEYQGVWYQNKFDGLGYYAENLDPCGFYTPHPITVPYGQPADTAFYLVYAGTIYQSCPNGPYIQSLFNYYYNYSNFHNNRPEFQGYMTVASGPAIAQTELHNIVDDYGDQHYAETGYNYFGCDLTKHCSNNGYALHVRGPGGSSWVTWTPSVSPHSSWVTGYPSPLLTVLSSYYASYTRKGQ